MVNWILFCGDSKVNQMSGQAEQVKQPPLHTVGSGLTQQFRITKWRVTFKEGLYFQGERLAGILTSPGEGN